MKYYEIMELECKTPIKNRSIGADFYICTEIEKEKIKDEILGRENNFYVIELTKEKYDIEKERIRIKNLKMIAGF